MSLEEVKDFFADTGFVCMTSYYKGSLYVTLVDKDTYVAFRTKELPDIDDLRIIKRKGIEALA